MMPIQSSLSVEVNSSGIASELDVQGDIQRTDSGAIATGIYVIVHGHFYQPPRENPYLDAIERQPSAAPFHDWNERIHYECYRPNAFARILNDKGDLIGIVNNFEYLSFNMGPTLMSWLERYDPEVYQRIVEADRLSCDRLNGHGNAIAQVYNHIILPLANERDKRTQIRWGKEDFRHRFGRMPEGMWLAETAVDYATLEVLVEEGIRFIILAPSQAQRCRPLPSDGPDESFQFASPEAELASWIEVGGGQIDPIRPYRCFLPGGDRTRDFIDIFFYDGPISRDMGFNDVLDSAHHFAGRIGQAVRGDHRSAQLISVATDGETFGHHKKGAEKALAYSLLEEFPQRGWIVTNYAHYLSLSSPAWEVELKPVTAWSCSHGVDRWQDDCGCGGGGLWNQQWRRPLRNALDGLRDRLSLLFEAAGCLLFCDPWAARDEYVHVIRDRHPDTVRQFLERHQSHPLTQDERTDALRLLEMQRQTLLMYTSCGWFFDEISRPEGVQILRYASRAIELAEAVSGQQIEPEFVQWLAAAPSNVDQFANGADVYDQLVVPSRLDLEQIVAHYAISSLFNTYSIEQKIYCYWVHQLDYQIQRIGPHTLAVGQLQLTSEITQESAHLVFGVLHLGGWDFHCCIKPFSGRLAYTQARDRLCNMLSQGNIAQMILSMNQVLGDRSYNLQNLFAEERHRLMGLLSQNTLVHLEQLYTQVYHDNYSMLMAFHRDHLETPKELQVAAEIAIGQKVISTLGLLERDLVSAESPHQQALKYLTELEAIANEARYLNCNLNLPQARQLIETLILQSLWHVIHDEAVSDDENILDAWIDCLYRLIDLGDRLQIGVTLDRAQETYWRYLHATILPNLLDCQVEASQMSDPTQCQPLIRLQKLLLLGQKLRLDVQHFLNELA
ncbi:MAG: DUF3536 domain-containing protein [Elainellaceae cyanobacterium]